MLKEIWHKHHTKIIPIVYVLFLLISALFVWNVLNTSEVEVEDKPETEQGFEEKPLRPTLQVYDINQNLIVEYETRINNTNSIEELLNTFRSENNFTYEKVAYTYGTEIDEVLGITATEGYRWVLYKGERDVTFEIGQENLEPLNENEKELIYQLRLIQSEELQ